MSGLERAKAIDVYNAAVKVYQALMKNAGIYGNPVPDLATFKKVVDTLLTAVTDYQNAGGGKVLAAAMEARRVEVIVLLQRLALYVSATADGDMEKLVCGGFPISKTRQPVGPLPAPQAPKMVHGENSGDAKASTRRDRGATSFDWRAALVSKPETDVATAQTTSTKATFNGLIPGELYQFQVRALGSAGPSDWSGAATLRLL